MAKNPLANAGNVRDAVRSLGREDSLEEETATHSGILAWRIPRTEEPGWQATVHGVAQSRTRLKRLSTHAQLTQHPGRNPPGARAQPRVSLVLSLLPPKPWLWTQLLSGTPGVITGPPVHPSPLASTTCWPGQHWVPMEEQALQPPPDMLGMQGSSRRPTSPILSLWVRTRQSSEHAHAAFVKPMTE